MDNLLLIKDFYKNKEIIKIYLVRLLKYIYSLNIDVESDNLLLSYLNIYPLPNNFIYSNEYFNVNDNVFKYIGPQDIHVNLYSNRFLPTYGNDPIPFSFPIIKNNRVKFVNSNVYYYEITILDSHREEWDTNTIGIGFSSINKINKVIGSDNDTFGYFSDGSFRYKNHDILTESWSPSDIVGIGIIYCEYNKIKPFITFNGILIELSEKYDFKNNIIPVITCNSHLSIKINLFNEQLKFNIENYLNNQNIFSTKNSFIQNNFNLKKYNTLNNKLTNNKLSILLSNNDNIISEIFSLILTDF